jgi:hypothetical protein
VKSIITTEQRDPATGIDEDRAHRLGGVPDKATCSP